MTRLEAIIAHLKAKGAQYLGDAGDKIVTEKFTEHIFRRLIPSVRVREYKDGGLIEILFVSQELCAGQNDRNFFKTPDMEWVRKTIDEEVKPQPDIPKAKSA